MKPDTRTGGGPSQRMLRVGELVRHALADVLSRGDHIDPVLAGHIITVPEVRMSPDLKIATCYVMPLGGKDITPVIQGAGRQCPPPAHRGGAACGAEERARAALSQGYVLR